MSWHIETLNSKVDEELNSLEPSLKAKFLYICELLEDFGPNLVGTPHIKPLSNKLWDIRMRGKSGIARAIYLTLTGQRIMIVHAFIKKTQKTPQSAIHIALERSKGILK